MQLSPLIEYLLAAPSPAGGEAPLCRLEILETTIPVFPPLTTLQLNVLPVSGSFSNIQFWSMWSPAIIPGAFNITITHAGSIIPSGVLGATALGALGFGTWIDIRESQPLRISYTNISGVSQFLESIDMFLVITSENDYRLIQQLIKDWGGQQGRT